MTAESPDIVGRLSVRPAIRSFLHAKKKKFAGHERTIQLKIELRMSPVQAQECSRDARRDGRFARKDVCDDQRLPTPSQQPCPEKVPAVRKTGPSSSYPYSHVSTRHGIQREHETVG